jgi:hypothetical protein
MCLLPCLDHLTESCSRISPWKPTRAPSRRFPAPPPVRTPTAHTYSHPLLLHAQVKALEDLCGEQQNSLEEAEERLRNLTSEQDELRTSLVAAKTQLVSAQAQVWGEGGRGGLCVPS